MCDSCTTIRGMRRSKLCEESDGALPVGSRSCRFDGVYLGLYRCREGLYKGIIGGVSEDSIKE